MRGIIRRGINAKHSSKVVGTRYSRNIGEFFRVSNNNRGNWNDGMNDNYKQLTIRICRRSGIAKVVGTKSRENIEEYLRNLLVKQAIIWNEGALREKVFTRT